jgi:DNA-binding MarR family transcriptional regulator
MQIATASIPDASARRFAPDSTDRFTHPSLIRAVKRRANAAGLTPATRLVLGALCDRLDGTGRCRPSHETLAEEAGVSRRTVIRSVQSLERSGILVRHVPPPAVRARRGPEACTRYLVILTASEARDTGSVLPEAGARDIPRAPGPEPRQIAAEKARDTVEGPAEKARDIGDPKHVTLLTREDTKEENKNTPAHTRARKEHVTGSVSVADLLAPSQIAALSASRRERSAMNRAAHAALRTEQARHAPRSTCPGELLSGVTVPKEPAVIAPPRTVSASRPTWTETERAAAVAATKVVRASGFRLNWSDVFREKLESVGADSRRASSNASDPS